MTTTQTDHWDCPCHSACPCACICDDDIFMPLLRARIDAGKPGERFARVCTMHAAYADNRENR